MDSTIVTETNSVTLPARGHSNPYPLDKSFAELFEAQVVRTPDSTAVIFEHETLTYRELNGRANQLARLLRQLGMQRGDFVGIFLERNCDFVVSILAVFKAGGAYIPIEPLYPDDRIQYMLANSAVRTLLTHSAVIDNFSAKIPPDSTLQNIVCLDSKRAGLLLENNDLSLFDTLDFSDLPSNNLDTVNSATDPAYMIYTSGSTGMPKGAIVRHNGAVNHIYAQFEALALDANLCFLQSAPSSSDISVWQFLAPLVIGGRTLIIDTESLCDSKKLVQIIRDHQVTIIEIVPAVLRGLLDYLARLSAQERTLPHLQWLMVTGEAVAKQLVNRWLELYPLISVVNAYGPTECSDDVTQYIVSQALPEHLQTVPIGKPLANLSVYIVDDALRLTPDGIPGEICIAGIGVGAGYWKDPEKTAKSFVPNPFSRIPDDILYKTGDLGRWLADGNLEYLGRIDHQVKIRGFRIELGEIEAKLAAHPDVRETVILANEDELGNKRLIAYLVPHKDPGPSASALRDYLKDQLPSHMLPSAFVLLDSFPLTPNGKIDRKALPEPHGTRPELTEAFVAPSTPLQETLSALWGELLKLDRIGINDNFFALGGHSLLATQIISRVRDCFRVDLPLRALLEAPTIANLSEKIAVALKTGVGLDAVPIAPVRRDQDLPLSFAQQRLWFLQVLDHGSDAYNMPEAIRLSGTLDTVALHQSLNEIVRRHEALRTTFTTVDGQPVQIITPTLQLELPIVDLTSLPEYQRAEEIERLALAEGKQTFDLSKDPLLRAVLLRLSAQEHVLFLIMHHIVSDDWSMEIFAREIAALYQSFSAGKSSPLPELAIQYADFAAWQRRWLQGEILETQLAYWKTRLSGLTTLSLPTDRPRPSVQRFAGATQSHELSPALAKALRALSRRANVTLFMTLLAAFKTLLYRYCEQTDIVVGSPVANRNREEIEGLIGFFVNTLVLRTDLSGNPSFNDLLVRVRETAFGAYAHQDLPFEKLVEALQPERDLSHNPLFQVAFALQNAGMNTIETEHLTLTPLEFDPGSAKFDLTLFVYEQRAGLKATLEYNIDLFDALTITRMLGHFQALLEGIVAAPESAISALPLLSEAERHQVLVEWNDTGTDYPKDQCIHHLFEAQVAQRPEAIALIFEAQRLTYHELNQRANQLAHYLRTLGVGPDVVVGLYLERSVELIIALLGILKAGGAYLALDPAYPQERLAFMLADAQVPVLLTQWIFAERLPAHSRVIYLTEATDTIALHSTHNLPGGVGPDHLAYVAYTSGSTGQPKGVAVPHRGVVRLVQKTNYVHFSSDEVLLQLAPVAFDASTFEIWGALLNGSRLVVFPAHTPSLDELADALRRYEITTLWLTAGLFHLMVDTYPEALSGLHQLLAGGDVLSPAHVHKARQAMGSGRLINGYGPTENTTFTCCYTVPVEVDGVSTVPIGRPVANTEVYVLDQTLQPVPIGVAGELYIGGAGLARGYLGESELTASKFIPHPFSLASGARLYQTGDRVRYRPDGTLEFLGRLDAQVKIRGFRIELGEIESVLAEHPTVQSTVVVARTEGVMKQIVAYVVPVAEQDSTVSELRSFLQARLPEYMLPSAFVVLEILPLTTNGKIDRQALPAPDWSKLDSGKVFVAPRDQWESQLTLIWEDILGIQGIGVKDNFFELGGHSLLAVRLVTQIKKVFGKSLPLVTLFKASTIEQLANTLRQEDSTACWFSLVAIQPNGSKPPFFCVPGGGGNLLGLRHLAHHLGSDQPFYGLQPISIGRNGAEPHRRVEDMAVHYLKEIRNVQPQGPYFLGGGCIGGVVAFEMAQQLHAEGEKVALLVAIDSDSPKQRAESITLARAFVGRMRYHVAKLKQLHIKGQLQYLKKCTNRKAKGTVNSVTYKLFLRMGLPVPYVTLDKYLTDINVQAVASYRSQRYPGKIILLWSKDEPASVEEEKLAWDRLAAKGTENYDIPGDHTSTFFEPNVQHLAKQVRLCIQSALSDHIRGS